MSADINFIKSVLSLHDEMASNGFSLVYEGEFSHEVMKMFTSMAERDMDKTNEEKAVKRKVFHVMVECLQNMTKHSESEFADYRFGKGLLMIGKKDDVYFITTSNKIPKKDIAPLTRMLEAVNSASKEELREMYKNQLLKGNVSNKGGAGLGFIDIVRKTGQKLDYAFFPLDDDHNFFVLKIEISAQSQENEEND